MQRQCSTYPTTLYHLNYGTYASPTLDQRIQVLRNLSSCNISDLDSQKIPEDKIPVAYIAGLNEKERYIMSASQPHMS